MTEVDTITVTEDALGPLLQPNHYARELRYQELAFTRDLLQRAAESAHGG